MPSKIVAAIAALAAFGASTMTPALAEGHGGGGGFHAGGGFHVGGGFHPGFRPGGGFGDRGFHFGGDRFGGRFAGDRFHDGRFRFHDRDGFAFFPVFPFAPVCSPYYLSYPYPPCY